MRPLRGPCVRKRLVKNKIATRIRIFSRRLRVMKMYCGVFGVELALLGKNRVPKYDMKGYKIMTLEGTNRIEGTNRMGGASRPEGTNR